MLFILSGDAPPAAASCVTIEKFEYPPIVDGEVNVSAPLTTAPSTTRYSAITILPSLNALPRIPSPNFNS